VPTPGGSPALSPVASRVPRVLAPPHARRARVACNLLLRARGSCESRVPDTSRDVHWRSAMKFSIFVCRIVQYVFFLARRNDLGRLIRSGWSLTTPALQMQRGGYCASSRSFRCAGGGERRHRFSSPRRHSSRFSTPPLAATSSTFCAQTGARQSALFPLLSDQLRVCAPCCQLSIRHNPSPITLAQRQERPHLRGVDRQSHAADPPEAKRARPRLAWRAQPR